MRSRACVLNKAQHYCTIDVTMYMACKKVIVAMSGGVDSTVVELMMKLSGKNSI